MGLLSFCENDFENGFNLRGHEQNLHSFINSAEYSNVNAKLGQTICSVVKKIGTDSAESSAPQSFRYRDNQINKRL